MSADNPNEIHTNGLTVIEGHPGEPLIVIAPMEHYRSLLTCNPLMNTRGAAYFVEHSSPFGPPKVYSGGTSLPAPVRLRAYRLDAVSAPPTRIIVVTRVGAPLSPPEARALERFGWNQVVQGGRAEPTNTEAAFGACLGHEGYKAMQTFWTKALQWLHPHCTWLLPDLLPPFYLEEFESVGLSSRQILTLRRKKLIASVELVHGGCILLPDSLVRRRVAATASVTASVLREELWAWGALEAVEDPALWRLTRRVWCPSLSAAFLLVLGYRGGRVDGWIRDNTTLSLPGLLGPTNVILFPSWRSEATL